MDASERDIYVRIYCDDELLSVVVRAGYLEMATGSEFWGKGDDCVCESLLMGAVL